MMIKELQKHYLKSKTKGGENKMKKILMIFLLLALTVFLTAGSSQAAMLNFTLGLPDILSDSTGSYSYNATTDLFKSDAQALQITYDGVTEINIAGGTYSVQFYVDNLGNFSGGILGNDLVITGTFTDPSNNFISGTLLTGDVTNFGWQDVGGSAAFNFTFDVTGGLLAGDFLTGEGGDLLFSDTSDFTGSWNSDHSGIKVKHDTAPVPEPGTLLLLGTGLAGLAFYRRRRK